MKLPETWLEVPLARVVSDIQPGFAQAPGGKDSGTVAQIRTHNVSADGHITLEEIRHVMPSQGELERYSLVPGDVVFNNTNSEEWVGKTAVFEEAGRYVFSNHMTRVRVNEEVIDPHYFARYLHLLWAVGFSRNRAKRWVSQAAIDVPTLAKFRVTLPTLAEQRRIVQMLRQAEGVQNLRSQQARELSRIARERFYELFGHPAENTRGYEVVSLTGLGDFDRGVSKHRPRDAAHLFGGPYPFIQTGDVANAGDWIRSYSQTYSEAGLAQSRLWPKGTLCITIAANIARAAILDFDACFPDSVVGFTPHAGVHTEYVLYCLRFYQEFFEHRAPKSAQMNINLEKLRALKVPKPPEPLQRKFSEFVHAIREIADLLEPQRRDMSSVRQQLQLAALSGELTKVWRERHQEEVESADAERRVALGEQLRGVSVAITERTPAERQEDLARPARAWLVERLSEFQRNVRMALYEWKGLVIPHDADAFDDFCRQWSIEHEQTANDRTRRALEQLAALGLVAKVSLRNDSGGFVIGFRPLREDENTRLMDAERITTLLTSRGSAEGSAQP